MGQVKKARLLYEIRERKKYFTKKFTPDDILDLVLMIRGAAVPEDLWIYRNVIQLAWRKK